MALISGYVGYGTAAPNGVLTELSGGSYAREAVTFSGSAAGGTLSASSTVAGSAAATLAFGAIFDASTGGNQILLFPLPSPVPVASGGAIAALSTPIAFSSGLYYNLSNAGLVFPPGFDFGSIGGQPLLAGTTIELSGGGTLIAGGGTLYVPSTTGAPTDTPAAEPGMVPMRIDPTNNKIWAYTTSGWKGVSIS